MEADIVRAVNDRRRLLLKFSVEKRNRRSCGEYCPIRQLDNSLVTARAHTQWRPRPFRTLRQIANKSHSLDDETIIQVSREQTTIESTAVTRDT